MKIDQIEIGDRVRKCRKVLNLTQEEFSENLGIGRVHLAKIELGLKMPSIDLLIAISESSDVTLDYLVLGRTSSSHEAKKRCFC